MTSGCERSKYGLSQRASKHRFTAVQPLSLSATSGAGFARQRLQGIPAGKHLILFEAAAAIVPLERVSQMTNGARRLRHLSFPLPNICREPTGLPMLKR